MSTDNKLTEERDKEERRRQARKNRIQGNAGSRLGYIAEQHNDPNKPAPKPIIHHDDDDENAVDSLTGSLSSSTQQPHQLPTTSPFANIGERRRFVKEPFSITTFRWFGVFLFSTLLASNNLSLCSNILSIEHPLFVKFGIQLTNNPTLKEFIYVYFPLALVWVIWEFVFCTAKPQRQQGSTATTATAVKPATSNFLPNLKSDGLLIVFFYAVMVDLILRYHHLLPDSFKQPELLSGIAEQQPLVDILYYPLILAVIGKIVLAQLPKQFPIINMNEMFQTAYQGLGQFTIIILSLLLFVEWWTCTACPCQGYGILYLMSNKRGLLVWTHACLNLVSRLLNL
ncbi:putative transmembrane protein [Cavenderia fasciculata]|uniref:Transmembrane protein n=1 Tax=Cavenderia fasciculata TaxID=261658 RepID=F4QA32_CACFS|nr:putative transmembrane protein [Cavenderia fasciculata]EGG15551.1 putative transmembrane protein [Cavenderia fasciculata]|eukprot:XP_004354293.1 putative transmembrane protein [Cavenderia fasciculata]